LELNLITGTPEGVGFKRTPPIFLRDGDIVEVEVETIGTLRNPVVRQQ
jgi:2-keto-4-pentenoate hydratase/2-oxohepta-3-ene-1,7-dioic acid hydratase in catechol pathway